MTKPPILVESPTTLEDIEIEQHYQKLAKTEEGRAHLMAHTAIGVDNLKTKMVSVDGRLDGIEHRVGIIENSLDTHRRVLEPPRKKRFDGNGYINGNWWKIILALVGVIVVLTVVISELGKYIK